MRISENSVRASSIGQIRGLLSCSSPQIRFTSPEKGPRVVGLSHRMSARVSDAALHIRSFLTDRLKQPEPRVFQWRRCLSSLVIAAPLPARRGGYSGEMHCFRLSALSAPPQSTSRARSCSVPTARPRSCPAMTYCCWLTQP